MNKKCTICEGVYDRQKIKKEFKRGQHRIIIKNSGFTVRSENPDRCQSCLDFEKGMKDTCYSCGRKSYNNIKDYIQNGNFCYACIREVNNKFKSKCQLEN